MKNRGIFPSYKMLMDAFERNQSLVDLLDTFHLQQTRQNLLSENVCQIVIAKVTRQGKLDTLTRMLDELEPLNERIINLLFEDIDRYIRIYEEMNYKRHSCGFRYIFNCLNPTDSEITRKCLNTCKKNGCYPWLTESQLMMLLKDPLNSDVIFKNLVTQQTEIPDNHYISANLVWLRKANLLTRVNLQKALCADKFASAIESLNSVALLGIFPSKFDAEKVKNNDCFNAEDSVSIINYLLRNDDGCIKLSTYEEYISWLDKTEESYFVIHRNIMLKLLAEIMPKEMKYTSESLPKPEICGSVDEAIHMCIKGEINQYGLFRYV